MRVPGSGLVALVLLLALGCTTTPVATPTPTPSPTRALPTATPEPLLDFPPTTAVALEPGRYSSQPPFDVPFSFAIAVEGWGTAHHNPDFFDVMQPVQLGVPPERWLAFARPAVLHGTEEIDAAGLTPADVVVAFESRGDIEMGEPRPYQVGGIAGLVVDMSTGQTDVEPFGGPGGDLQLDPAYEGRTIIVPVDGAPLLIMVFAPRGQLEEAWADSQPIVDSITW